MFSLNLTLIRVVTEPQVPKWIRELLAKLAKFANFNLPELLAFFGLASMPMECMLEGGPDTPERAYDAYFNVFWLQQMQFWVLVIVGTALSLIFWAFFGLPYRQYFKQLQPFMDGQKFPLPAVPRWMAMVGAAYGITYVPLLSSAAKSWDCTNGRLDDAPAVTCGFNFAQIAGFFFTFFYIFIWVYVVSFFMPVPKFLHRCFRSQVESAIDQREKDKRKEEEAQAALEGRKLGKFVSAAEKRKQQQSAKKKAQKEKQKKKKAAKKAMKSGEGGDAEEEENPTFEVEENDEKGGDDGDNGEDGDEEGSDSCLDKVFKKKGGDVSEGPLKVWFQPDATIEQRWKNDPKLTAKAKTFRDGKTKEWIQGGLDKIKVTWLVLIGVFVNSDSNANHNWVLLNSMFALLDFSMAKKLLSELMQWTVVDREEEDLDTGVKKKVIFQLKDEKTGTPFTKLQLEKRFRGKVQNISENGVEFLVKADVKNEDGVVVHKANEAKKLDDDGKPTGDPGTGWYKMEVGQPEKMNAKVLKGVGMFGKWLLFFQHIGISVFAKMAIFYIREGEKGSKRTEPNYVDEVVLTANLLGFVGSLIAFAVLFYAITVSARDTGRCRMCLCTRANWKAGTCKRKSQKQREAMVGIEDDYKRDSEVRETLGDAKLPYALYESSLWVDQQQYLDRIIQTEWKAKWVKEQKKTTVNDPKAPEAPADFVLKWKLAKLKKRKNNHKNLIKEAKPVGNELKKKAKEARKLAAKAEKGKGRREKQADDDDEKASSG